MNIITIDPSLTCTAVVINDKKFVFASEDVALSKTGRQVKWFEAVDPYVTVRLHSFNRAKMSHADKEMAKIAVYESIARDIVSTIESNLEAGQAKVYIEGYSYSSAAGPLIDLVTFGTLVRHLVRAKITEDVRVITPTELKMYSARFTYPAITGKKNEVVRNHLGVSGGKFKKPEMYKALTENTSLDCEWVKMLREHASDILSMKSVPKPIEDMNDAKLMYEIAKSNKYF